MPQEWVFPQFVTPKIYFENRALSLLYPYGTLNSCKKLEKTNKRSEIFEDGLTDHGQTDHGWTGAITKDPLR